MIKELKYWSTLLLAGMVIGIGMKIIDWGVPRPKQEVIHKVDDASKCLGTKKHT